MEDLLISSSNSNAKPRKAIQLACHDCHRRKVKCTFERPQCSNCKRRDVDCSYPKESRKRRKVLDKKSVDSEIEQRLKRLENIILSSKLQVPQDSPEKESSRCSTPSEPSEHEQHRDSFFTLPDQSIEGLEPEISPHWNHRRFIIKDGRMPHPKVRKRLINVYFKTLQHIQPMIHPPTFMEREQKGENSDLLILAICAASSIFAEDPEKTNTPLYYLGEPFASRAQYIIQTNLMKPSLDTIQALGTLFMYEYNSGNFAIAQMYLELAFHYLKLLRIYRLDEDYQDDTLLSPKEWVEKETKRRLFWIITIKDRIISSELGVPQLVDLFDCEVRVPCDEYYWVHSLPSMNAEKMDSDEEEMAIGMNLHSNQFSIRVKITLILGQISRYANRPKTKRILSKRSLTERFAVLEYALSAWWHHLPPEFKQEGDVGVCSKANTNIPSVELIRHYKMMYYMANILLHRTYLAQMADLYNTSQSLNSSVQDAGVSVPESCLASMTKCTSIAFAVTRMIESYHQFQFSWLYLFSTQAVFIASTIHLNNIFSATGELAQKSKEAFDVHVHFLQNIKNHCILAGSQLKILQKLELVCSNINRRPNPNQPPGTVCMQWIAPTSTGANTWQDTLEEAFNRYCDTPFKDLAEASMHQQNDRLASPDNPFRVGFSQDFIPLPESNLNSNSSQIQVACDPAESNANSGFPDLVLHNHWKSELNPICYDRSFVEKMCQELKLSADAFDFFPLFDSADTTNHQALHPNL